MHFFAYAQCIDQWPSREHRVNNGHIKRWMHQTRWILSYREFFFQFIFLIFSHSFRHNHHHHHQHKSNTHSQRHDHHRHWMEAWNIKYRNLTAQKKLFFLPFLHSFVLLTLCAWPHTRFKGLCIWRILFVRTFRCIRLLRKGILIS